MVDQPNRSIAARSWRTIGVVTPYLGGFYFGGVVAGVTRAAARAGLRVVAVQTFPTRLARDQHPPSALPGSPGALDLMDAIVVVTEAMAPDALGRLVDEGRPLVLVGTDAPTVRAPVLRPDNVGGARAAVEHLLQHGHTRIGFAGDLTQGDIRERYQGYRDALEARGIRPDDDWLVVAPGNSAQGGGDAAEALLAVGSATTAMLVATDAAALGLMRALQASGATLPRDLAVIGFDRTDGGARHTPRLSSVDLHHDRVGERAVAHLLARLRGADGAEPSQPTPFTLAARESCGCARVTTSGGPRVPDPPGPATGAARGQVHHVAATAFAGPTRVRGAGRTSGDSVRTTWAHAVLDPLDAAAARGAPATPSSLRALQDLTGSLGPYPETLEQCLAAVRQVEHELLERAPDESRRAAIHRATTDVLLALTRGCLRPALLREAAMERAVADQHEVDTDVMAGRGATARSLTWLPGGGRTAACLGLWTGPTTASGDRELEVVSATARSGTLARSIGRRVAAAQFPPSAMLRGQPLDGSALVLVVPVTSPRTDWGLLAVSGRLDVRMTHSRERHQHWGALLAMALDAEQQVAGLRGEALARDREATAARAAVAALRVQDERTALWLRALEHGLWDWDVATGAVFWSPQWAALLGLRAEEVGSEPSEWLDRVHPDDRRALSALIAAQLGGATGAMRLEHRVRHASGEYRWMLCVGFTVPNEAGVPARMVGALLDVTDRRDRETALTLGTLRDAATGLPNRTAFLDRLVGVLERTHAGDADGALATLRVGRGGGVDADGPDPVVALSTALAGPLRHGDVVGRLAPDTLACLLLDHPGATGATRLAAVLDGLPAEHRRHLSVGLVESVRPFDDVGDLLRGAEVAALRDGSDVGRR